MKNLSALVSALPQTFWNSADSALTSLQSGRGGYHQHSLVKRPEDPAYSGAVMPLKYPAEQVQVQFLLKSHYFPKTRRRILPLPSRTTDRNINFHLKSSHHVNKRNNPISPSARRDNECC